MSLDLFDCLHMPACVCVCVFVCTCACVQISTNVWIRVLNGGYYALAVEAFTYLSLGALLHRHRGAKSTQKRILFR